jgi:hypothetical protein
MRAIADLKVGTKLESTKQYPKYGIYSNMVVSEIKETKSGRLLVYYTYAYTSVDGDVTNGTTTITNAPVNPNTALSLYNF